MAACMRTRSGLLPPDKPPFTLLPPLDDEEVDVADAAEAVEAVLVARSRCDSAGSVSPLC